MIEYDIKYTCDDKDCNRTFTNARIVWYFRMEAMFPTIPDGWAAITEEGKTVLYCPSHLVTIDSY